MMGPPEQPDCVKLDLSLDALPIHAIQVNIC